VIIRTRCSRLHPYVSFNGSRLANTASFGTTMHRSHTTPRLNGSTTVESLASAYFKAGFTSSVAEGPDIVRQCQRQYIFRRTPAPLRHRLRFLQRGTGSTAVSRRLPSMRRANDTPISNYCRILESQPSPYARLRPRYILVQRVDGRCKPRTSFPTATTSLINPPLPSDLDGGRQDRIVPSSVTARRCRARRSGKIVPIPEAAERHPCGQDVTNTCSIEGPQWAPGGFGLGRHRHRH